MGHIQQFRSSVERSRPGNAYNGLCGRGWLARTRCYAQRRPAIKQNPSGTCTGPRALVVRFVSRMRAEFRERLCSRAIIQEPPLSWQARRRHIACRAALARRRGVPCKRVGGSIQCSFAPAFCFEPEIERTGATGVGVFWTDFEPSKTVEGRYVAWA